jgi:hypothetical protein
VADTGVDVRVGIWVEEEVGPYDIEKEFSNSNIAACSGVSLPLNPAVGRVTAFMMLFPFISFPV